VPLSVEQSRRLARSVRLAAGALLVGTCATLAGMIWSQREDALKASSARNALLSRVLEDQATRDIESAGLVLRTLGEDVALAPRVDTARIQPMLGQALIAQPMLRSLAVIDADGRILVSSQANDQGVRLPLDSLGHSPIAGQDALWPLRSGRGLRDLTRGDDAASPVKVLPLVRHVRGADGRDLLLFALINPDTLSNALQTAIGDGAGEAAALVGYDGRLLAATTQIKASMGSVLHLPAELTERLDRADHGAYRGSGLVQAGQLVAYRTSRSRPLLVLVEQSQHAALDDWYDSLAWWTLAGGVAILLIVGSAAMLLRNLKAHELARRDLDRAHEKVALRERELSVLFKSVQELLFRTDAQGRLSFVNAHWAALRQESIDKALGRPLSELVAAGDDRAAVADLFAHDDRVGARTAQVALHAPDGQARHLQMAVVPLLDRDGQRILGFAGSAMDVTDRVLAERAIRQARDSAEEASRAKSEFIANISHELRTPLQSILGFSELGVARTPANPRVTGMFEDIHTAGQRMLALVNDLLDVSKFESTVGTFHLERCDLRELVKAVTRELAPLLVRRQLRLALRVPEWALKAKVDPLRIQQVLRNVLANAIKFSPEGGLIEIEADYGSAQDVRIAVSDCGPGIPPAELEDIFDAFVQSSKTKDGSGGTGLGLAISRKIVALHGGTLRAENRSSGGARFALHLPTRASADSQFCTVL